MMLAISIEILMISFHLEYSRRKADFLELILNGVLDDLGQFPHLILIQIIVMRVDPYTRSVTFHLFSHGTTTSTTRLPDALVF